MPLLAHPDRKVPLSEPGGEDPEPPGTSLPRLRLRVGLLALVAAAAAALVGPPWRPAAVVYEADGIAREDVRAARDFLLSDLEATERKRREAEEASPAVYDLHPGALDEALGRLRGDLSAAFSQEPPDLGAAAAELEGRWGMRVAPELVRRLSRADERARLVGLVEAALGGLYGRGVVANRRLLAAELRRGVVVRTLGTREESVLGEASLAAVEDFDEVRRRLGRPEGGDPLSALAQRTAGVLFRPNVTHNGEETALRRAAARDSVRPVLLQVSRGEMLVREGDRVTVEQARRLAAHGALAEGGGGWLARLGVLGLAAMALGCCFRFGRSNVKKFRSANRDLLFLAALVVAGLALERLGLTLVAAVGASLASGGHGSLAFALPLAAAVITARVVLNSETALVFLLPFLALAALPFEPALGAFLHFAAGSLAGAHFAARACHRLDVLRAGAGAGLAQAVVAASLALAGGAGGGEAAWWIGASLLGGVASGILALGLIPLAEGAFGYTTEMRLMELASLDHPLLRELMLRAPGTYHHSLVTGSLVKAAAEAIGARALLATVAAYYHDVGKVSKPIYFIENQADGGNLHDKLAPSMSSLVLVSHVKEGVDLARRHRLGADLVEIIQQHHGTSLIQFFYGRACERARAGVEAVREADYRYPGPKPQTREAALVLLADAVEAACRTLPDPRPARIRGVVQNIINRTFADGQLDECDLTLKDLHDIARSFSRILGGIHHQRIDYPLAAHKEKKPHGDLDPKRLRGGRDRRGEAPEAGPEGLKRLGL